MAQVIFAALDRAKVIPRSHVSFVRRDAEKSRLNEQKFGITSTTLETLVSQSDVIFLSVRPQQATDALLQLKGFDLNGKMVISILAGTTLSFFENKLGPAVQVIRVMPNIASEVNQGMTIVTHGAKCSVEFKSFVNILFGSMGQVSVQPESLMDVACGMAGSGPGFVLRLIDAMARVGIKQGMSEEDALKIAAQTFKGAAALVAKGLAPSELLSQIATPQGVTAAGFESMTRTNVDAHFMMAIESAAARSKDLSS